MMVKIASDVVMEILFATNRFSRSDLREFTADNKMDLKELRSISEDIIRREFPNPEMWDEDFLHDSLDFWFTPDVTQ